MRLRIHHFQTSSLQNGPGDRAVVWTQGCSLRCAGCFNEATHDARPGRWIDIDDLAVRLNSLPIRGVTLSGGEPLQQPRALSALLDRLAPRLDILLFSGFSLEEARVLPEAMQIVKRCDAALMGRYDQTLAHPYFGKDLVVSTGRIAAAELAPHRDVEIILGATSVMTGLPQARRSQPFDILPPTLSDKNESVAA